MLTNNAIKLRVMAHKGNHLDEYVIEEACTLMGTVKGYFADRYTMRWYLDGVYPNFRDEWFNLVTGVVLEKNIKDCTLAIEVYLNEGNIFRIPNNQIVTVEISDGMFPLLS